MILPLQACVASVVAMVLFAPGATAQDSKPGSSTLPGADTLAAIEKYLDERNDAAATTVLEQILAQKDAFGQAVAEALRRSATTLAPALEDLVPYRDQLLATTIQCPAGLSRAGERKPVVFDIGGGDAAAPLKLTDAIVCFVHGNTPSDKYTPPEFSDEGRDGFLKVLRRVCHRVHGDPGRMWLTGFSWAGHASFDTALHRPDWVRGIVPLAGAPRHVQFRLLPNLHDTETLAFTGKKDDPILVWNLEETGRLATGLKIPYRLTEDPGSGHELPLQGIDGVAHSISVLPPRRDASVTMGTILADSALVESPLLRFDAIDESRVKQPDRLSVQPGLSEEELRRARIKAIDKKVVKLAWKIETAKGGAATLSVDADGVRSFTVFLREPWFAAGQKVTVRAKGRILFNDTLIPDPKTMLVEARRTGERLRPVFRAIEVK